MAAAAIASSQSDAADGPVINLINKRLRALRKKLNRIAQMEESIAQGKTLNKEQDETLRSKSSVLAAIEELEKLRQPLSEAVSQEISLAVEKKHAPRNDDALGVSDLIGLLYFGSMFDVKTLMTANDNLMTRTHERSCCLTYDYVTDDDVDPLKESDFDLIARLGGLLISRPSDSSLSHEKALGRCVEHARLWIENSKETVEPDSHVTYAGLRERLNKIMASEYFTTTPGLKAPVEVAAADGNYTSFQVPVQVEGSTLENQQEEEKPSNEIYNDQNIPVEESNQGGGSDEWNSISETVVQPEQPLPDTEADKNSSDFDANDQQFSTRRPHRGGGGGGGRGGGGRRGYYNGGGGRRGSGRGGYQSGRGQFYDQPGNYYPKRPYNNYRGRGGRGGGMGSYHARTDDIEAAS